MQKSVPQELKGVIFERDVDGEHVVQAYMDRVREACDFLVGQSREWLAQVEEEMKAAAGRLDFEKAAELRNLLGDLKTTVKPMTRFTRKSLPTTVNPEADREALREALGLGWLPRVMECFDISNISPTHIMASMVRFREGVPDRAGYRKYRIHGTPHQAVFCQHGGGGTEALRGGSPGGDRPQRGCGVQLGECRGGGCEGGRERADDADSRPDHRGWRPGPAFKRLQGAPALRSA